MTLIAVRLRTLANMMETTTFRVGLKELKANEVVSITRHERSYTAKKVPKGIKPTEMRDNLVMILSMLNMISEIRSS